MMVKDPRKVFDIEDKWGNVLSLNSNMKLNLKIGSKSFMIGRITTCKPPFKGFNYWKTEKESDTYRRTNAWSIGYEILNRLEDGYIIIDTEIGRYQMPAKEALIKGQFLHFKKSGVERKKYIPKHLFTFIKNN